LPACILSSAPCTLHPAPCTLHPAPCTLHPAPCTLHPAPCTLYLPQAGRMPAPPAYPGPRQVAGVGNWPGSSPICRRV